MKGLIGIFILFAVGFAFLLTDPLMTGNILSENEFSCDLAKIENRLCNELKKRDEVRVIIKLKDNKKFGFKEKKLHNIALVENILGNVPEEYFKFNGILTNAFSGIITKEGIDILSNNENIEKIILSKPMKISLQQSLPLINATDVWAKHVNGINITGNGETICIIDSGINYSHPDLGGCTENEFLNGNCEKVIGGFDYCGNTGKCGTDPPDNNPMDNEVDSHGTHVAGIVAANGGIFGVAPEAKLIAIKVANSTGDAFTDDIGKAITWCTDNSTKYNISVISISLGNGKEYGINGSDGNCITDIDSDINYARSENISVIVASGNQGFINGISYTACSPNVTSVGASYDKNFSLVPWNDASCSDANTTIDQVACGSNRGSNLDLFAPGCLINSTKRQEGGYIATQGTSQSAPHVAGAVALLLQFEKLNNRNMIPQEIEDRFKDTGKLIYDVNTSTYYPRVDIYSAIFPIDVSNLQRVSNYTNGTVFRFDIKNNFNNKTLDDVSWSFDIGNGTIEESDYKISLSPDQTAFVFFEQNYSSMDGDKYTINATISSESEGLTDTEILNVNIGDIIAYDLMKVYNNSKEYVFLFKILNNLEEEKSVNWTFNTGEGPISSTELISLNPNKDVFVFFHYNYTSGGSYTVNATAFNGSYSDYTDDVTINVP